ncbi:uncharacterized protein UV8b_02276 [Ustilaginoidea virens]|uniref:Uncharacterized protein n=1 Tax=Ustilaginoidea virens TaxID=1159556 RepID=A0A8E5HM70_USTVR|nr:uncharacterized protein UV8b_02276 [Ustilaginoidea virens]QUC18035.1 hypothetical protein UV8b_02276 [Ustilaginoidea virens]
MSCHVTAKTTNVYVWGSITATAALLVRHGGFFLTNMASASQAQVITTRTDEVHLAPRRQLCMQLRAKIAGPSSTRSFPHALRNDGDLDWLVQVTDGLHHSLAPFRRPKLANPGAARP